MTQKQQIDLLNSIMPEIVSTKDPESVMLKCAKDHNLAPAQLEKLAQVFNTTKTLVGLEKQANRGDSFSLVDVPGLVASYVTYSPEQHVSRESQSVHNKVNKLMKEAADVDGWGFCLNPDMNKAASAGSSSPGALPDFMDIVNAKLNNHEGGAEFFDADQNSEYIQVEPGTVRYDVMHKSASVLSNTGEMKQYQDISAQINLAADEAEQAEYEAGVVILEKCAELRMKFTPDEGRWGEAAEDIIDGYGEKAAAVIAQIEKYFEDNRFHYEPYDLSKRAFVRPLVQDRHDVFPIVDEILELQEIRKQATSVGDAILRQIEENERASGKTPTPSSGNEEQDEAARRMAQRKEWDRKRDEEIQAQIARTDAINEEARHAPSPSGKSERENVENHPTEDPDGEADPTPEQEPAPEPAGDAGGGGTTPPEVPELSGTPAPSGGYGDREETLVERAPKVVVKDIDELISGMQRPFFQVNGDVDQPLKNLDKLLKYVKPGTNNRQRTVDKALDRAKMETTMQQLMLSDPTIRDADPHTVNDIFETIASISPTYAMDPMKMAPVLKEALQYDAVPVHILKELASQEGQILKNDELRRNLDSTTYDLSRNG